MKTTRLISAVSAILVATSASDCVAQQKGVSPWIKPAWPNGKEPQFPNRAFCWTSASAMPNKLVAYRLVTSLSSPHDFLAVRILSPGHVYLYVDGEEVYAADKRREEHVIAVRRSFAAGDHVLVVAAPAEGFAVTGGFFSSDRWKSEETGFTILPPASLWRVKKFPPTTTLELEPIWKPRIDDSAWHPVELDPKRGLSMPGDGFIPVLWQEEIKGLSSDLDDAEWRLSLIARKGIAIMDSIAYYGWGPERVSPAAVAAARKGLSRIPELREPLAALRNQDVRDGATFTPNRPALHNAAVAVLRTKQLTEASTNVLFVGDQIKNLTNCSLLLKQAGKDFASDLEQLRSAHRSAERSLAERDYDSAERNARECMMQAQILRGKMERAWGHPLNRYNESRFSIMGWIPNADLVDGELADWGLHVGSLEAPTVLSLPRRWRFKLDPDNEGLARGWHTVGFNIEDQWPTINVPGTWENRYKDANPKAAAQNPYKNKADVSDDRPYNGFAWYRARIRIPEEWRGNDVELRMSWANDWDWTYFNEQLVGKTGPETPDWTKAPRRYSLPRNLVKFGEENVIAVRVFDAGGEGGLGEVELRCPGLVANGTSQSASVIRSFLSPGILLQARGKELTVWGKNEAEGSVMLPLREGHVSRKLRSGQSAYRIANDGKLTENWLLWSPGFAGSSPNRPVQIVLEKNPVEVKFSQDAKQSSFSLVFAEPGARVVLIRALQTAPSGAPPYLDKKHVATCRFWARALLEYPLDYTEMTRLDPNNTDNVQVYDIYNYQSLANEWGIEPLRLAPAPVFLTYALRTRWPGLSVLGETADTKFDLGKYGTYRAVLNSNIISYRYPRDKILRLGGFTSWVFMPWDAGVPGNDRECEVIAQTGSNTYRPQHNFAGDKPRIFADYCNKYGINYMNNPDNELGGKEGKRGENVEAWVNHYRELAEMFKDRPEYAVAYDLINEAANMKPEIYNPLIKRLTDEIRKIDPVHFLYVETCNSWGAVEQFPSLAVTGDSRTIYSFHDYNFRIRDDDRWPSLKWDIQQMYKRWMPAFDFQLKNHVRLHLGEFGGYEKGGEFNPCAVTMLHDTFRILDQFNWHFNYYPGRGIMWPRADGSLRPNRVAWAFKRYFDLRYFNMYFSPGERRIISPSTRPSTTPNPTEE